jgi:hypothetical protein
MMRRVPPVLMVSVAAAGVVVWAGVVVVALPQPVKMRITVMINAKGISTFFMKTHFIIVEFKYYLTAYLII